MAYNIKASTYTLNLFCVLKVYIQTKKKILILSINVVKMKVVKMISSRKKLNFLFVFDETKNLLKKNKVIKVS